MKSFDIIVIGAGAAGLLAAGRAAELGARVLLLERNERPGRKLLITGKGRCNITNTAPRSEFMKKVYPNPRFLKHAFATFFTDDIIRLLNGQGMETIVERGDRVFPASQKSVDVVDTLMRWVRKNGVETRFDQRVENLLLENGKVTGVRLRHNEKVMDIPCGKVIIATGGKSYPATGSTGDGYRLAEEAGHSIVPLQQSLVPLETAGDAAQKMQGLSLKNVKASVWIDGKKAADEFGEMLFTHFGLSGPIILTLSRLMVTALKEHKKVEVSVDLKPALDEGKLDKRLLRDINEQGRRKMSNMMRLWLPAAMVPVFLEITAIDPEMEGHQLPAALRRKTMLLMKDLRFKITGCRSFKEAIITAGGVSTKEISPTTLESKLIKNLYFAGEVLDLDADTGGYNLQIAWSTGWLAGEAAATSSET
ncbi:MAG: NAD(P)/FAD-dependent oxidoreductase [Bacteroidales bacterium]|nr:NAD(P)/FAD-dependent oxidoreductase [Bacteroidales bacterium]